MKKRIVIAVAALVVLGIAAAVLVGIRSPRNVPVYQGRTARQWLEQIFTTNQRSAMEAWRKMGPEAFPVLVEALETKHSLWDKTYRWMYPKLPVAWQRHLTRPLSDSEQETIWSAAELVLINNRENARKLRPELARVLADKSNKSRRYTIGAVIDMIGPEDAECVPALIDCLQEKEFGTRSEAFHGLAAIGPAARAAVPALTAALHDPSLDTRALAALALWRIDGQKDAAVAVFHEVLNSPERLQMKGWAPVYLHSINPDDTSLIPLFIERLQGSNEGLQLSAASVLGGYGKAAAAAVPALIKALDSRNYELRRRALMSLQQIDPETAAKYQDQSPSSPASTPWPWH